jgi:hypothetical protein
MYCPRCGSSRLSRSHTRGWVEKLAKKCSYKAFRCREAECDWRGLIKVKGRDQNTLAYLAKFRIPFILMTAFLFSLTIFLFFVNID